MRTLKQEGERYRKYHICWACVTVNETKRDTLKSTTQNATNMFVFAPDVCILKYSPSNPQGSCSIKRLKAYKYETVIVKNRYAGVFSVRWLIKRTCFPSVFLVLSFRKRNDTCTCFGFYIELCQRLISGLLLDQITSIHWSEESVK